MALGDHGDREDQRQTVEKVVLHLAMLSRSDEACRLLGVDGVLVDKADITLLDDPLEYLAHDLAAAVREVDEGVEVPRTMLSTLVGELRMCSLIVAHIDQHDLVERVLRQLGEATD